MLLMRRGRISGLQLTSPIWFLESPDFSHNLDSRDRPASLMTLVFRRSISILSIHGELASITAWDTTPRIFASRCSSAWIFTVRPLPLSDVLICIASSPPSDMYKKRNGQPFQRCNDVQYKHHADDQQCPVKPSW